MIDSVAVAFSKQSAIFDALEEENEILQWMRNQVHAHCLHYYKEGESILELNCGTGIDAVFFAQHGMKVHATDLSEGMLHELKRKTEAGKLEDKITAQQCSYLELHNVRDPRDVTKKFDHIFSDFGGLNCTDKIEKVILQFKDKLRPGGTVTLVMMPPVCPWEILSAAKGNFKTAFRRWKKKGTDSNVEGIHFMTYYYTPSRIIKMFGNNYSKLELQSLGSFVPPPYMENFPRRHPKLFAALKKTEEKLKHIFPFNRWTDHFILTMKLN